MTTPPTTSGRPAWMVCWLGQAGFALTAADGTRVLIDPYLSNMCYRYGENLRLFPPPLSPSQIGTDLLLLTHEHRDHCDPGLVPQLLEREPGCLAAAPAGCVTRCENDFGVAPGRVTTVAWGDRFSVGEVQVDVVPAVHTVDAVGYQVTCEGVAVYASGDTVQHPNLYSTEYRPDLAAVCVNGEDGNMLVDDAVAHVRTIGARWAVPMHIELFRDNHDLAVEFERQLVAEPDGPAPFLMTPGITYALEPGAEAPRRIGPVQTCWPAPELR